MLREFLILIGVICVCEVLRCILVKKIIVDIRESELKDGESLFDILIK